MEYPREYPESRHHEAVSPRPEVMKKTGKGGLMGRSEKEQLKKRLLDTRAQMLHQGKIGMRRAMSGKAAGDFDGVRDEGDVSSYEQSEMLHYAVLGSMREIIRQIEEALERLAGGVYGI